MAGLELEAVLEANASAIDDPDGQCSHRLTKRYESTKFDTHRYYSLSSDLYRFISIGYLFYTTTYLVSNFVSS